MFPLIFESLCAHKIKFLLCNILPGLICIWKDVYEIMCKHFRKEHLCARQVFFCALVSRLVCARTRALQLRGNIVDDLFSQVYSLSVLVPQNVSNRHKRTATMLWTSELYYSAWFDFQFPWFSGVARKERGTIWICMAFLWRYAPVRRTGTFFQGKKKIIFYV